MPTKKKATPKKAAVKKKVAKPVEEQVVSALEKQPELDISKLNSDLKDAGLLEEDELLMKETRDNLARVSIKLAEVDKVIKRAEMKAKEPIGPHSKDYKPQVKALEGFVDGMLSQFFWDLGYPTEWRKDEVREIPLWLLDRCRQSGGEFEVLNG